MPSVPLTRPRCLGFVHGVVLLCTLWSAHAAQPAIPTRPPHTDTANSGVPIPNISPDVTIGARLYREGVRADGSPLTATRLQGFVIKGREAACVQCHRPSGMGGAEGSIAVPPIMGSVLWAPTTPPPARIRQATGITHRIPMAQNRPAYDLTSLEQALNQGTAALGTPMNELMPRYHLSSTEVRQIAAYLDTLSRPDTTGTTDGKLHLTTVYTRDTPPDIRKASTELLTACLAERSPRPSSSPAAPPLWQMDEWELSADPQQWQQELRTLQAQRPAFAIISAITGTSGQGPWQPIQRFCEAQQLPCILPNTVSIDDTLPTHWTFQFSRGVSLEASAIVEFLGEQRRALPETETTQPWRLHQVVTDSEASQTGARRLEQRWHQQFPQDLVLKHPDSTALNMDDWGPRDVLVLWLDTQGWKRWLQQHPKTPKNLQQYMASGEMLALDTNAIPTSWRAALRLTWPYDPPDRDVLRQIRNSNKWITERAPETLSQPTLVRLQGHTYSACEVAANALRRMGQRINPAYFLELVESAEEAATATAYPRFTLGPGQRQGSHGTWIVGFPSAPFEQLRPMSEWMTPP